MRRKDRIPDSNTCGICRWTTEDPVTRMNWQYVDHHRDQDYSENNTSTPGEEKVSPKPYK